MKHRILVKYPSRGRPERFFIGLDSVYNNIAYLDYVSVLVSADEDDASMNNPKVIDRLKEYENLTVVFGTSNSKIEAVNRDMDRAGEWDIVFVMSDDMRITFYGWDEVVRSQFPHLDRLTHIPDQDAKEALATVYIAGKTFYERFGYIYNPIYKSLFCDNEIMEIAKHLGLYHYYNCPGVIVHENMAYGHQPKDEMFIQQQEIGWTVDQETYYKRKALNFGL